MSNDFELSAKVRTDLGKGASRRLRRISGEIPAIIYGEDKEPLSITLLHKDIARAVENEAFFSHIITLDVDGKKEQVVIKDLQRHPARPFIMHADFLRVSATHAIHVQIPVHFINEDKCKGVKQGGNIIKAMTEIEVTCLPKDLPEYLEVDMTEVGLGESVHLSDVKFPSGVSSVDLSHGEDSDHAVATIQAPRGEKGADDEEGGDEEAGE